MEGTSNNDLCKMPNGPKGEFQVDNKIGKINGFENRQTGKLAKGSEMLKGAQMGKKEGADSVKN